MEEVVDKLNDLDYLRDLTERAYRDIIMSGRYSYQAMIKEFDETVLRYLQPHPAVRRIKFRYRLARITRLIELILIGLWILARTLYRTVINKKEKI